MTSPRRRLFIPGPTEVRPEILQLMATPGIGHHTDEFTALHRELHPMLQDILMTRQRVIPAACAASGLMEACVRNLSKKRILSLTCGGFSERFHAVAGLNNKPADAVAADWGRANTAESLRAKLTTGAYDLVTVCMNETSTGVLNPIAEITAEVKRHPGVLLAVDAVSCMAGVPIPVDAWNLDVCFAGTQKCWGLPPGLTIFAVSDAALQRAHAVENRGHYFDFVAMAERHDMARTPYTPSIPHWFALREQCRHILHEGLDRRYTRHLQLAQRVRDWGAERFGLFADPAHLSPTVTVFHARNGWNAARINPAIANHGYVIGDGHGKLKDDTFRIAHMGDMRMEDIDGLLRCMDDNCH